MLPEHLSGTSPVGIVEGATVAQFEIGSMQNLVYLLLDWQTHHAAIVDPQKDLRQPLDALHSHGFTLSHVLLTHSHFDHTAGVPELARTHPEVPIVCHPLDHHRLAESLRGQIHGATDGEVIWIGTLRVTMLHTPGHSAGGCCYKVDGQPPLLLTGDTVFVRDCGRTDLETGSTEEMFESLQRLRRLPLETIILPGHHYAPEVASTLERELQESGPFKARSVAELGALP